MVTITNNAGIPLALAVWLIHDEYDYINEPNYISATGLMKPLRHIILPKRIDNESKTLDIEDFISRALGHSIHDSMEKAWKAGNAHHNLRKLGYPDNVIDRILINPTDAEIDEFASSNGAEPIPVWLEQRMFREIEVDGKTYIIGGKFDAVTDGIVNDTKSTSAWSAMFGSRDEDYQEQGSIYKWIDADGYSDISLSPESKFRPRITEDYIRINYVFTDWQKAQAKNNPAYPQRRVAQKEVRLLDVSEIEAKIRHKIRLITRYIDAPESEIPHCTAKELWQSDPQFKFYKDPAKANQPGARSTKNFDTLHEAEMFQAQKHGGQGVVKTIPGEPKRCGYCDAYDICTQRKRLGL